MRKHAAALVALIFCLAAGACSKTAGESDLASASIATSIAISRERNIKAAQSPTQVTAAQIREALASPDDDVYLTPLGTAIVRNLSDKFDQPDVILLDGRIVFTARLGVNGYDKYDLRVVSFDTNGKKKAAKRITRMLVEEGFGTYGCQQILLDFTGPRIWISHRFPEWVKDDDGCVSVTWVSWTPPFPFIYFGEQEEAWIYAYKPEVRRLIGPSVDAPRPPKGASLIPRLKPH